MTREAIETFVNALSLPRLKPVALRHPRAYARNCAHARLAELLGSDVYGRFLDRHCR